MTNTGLVPEETALDNHIRGLVEDIRQLCGHPDNWARARRDSIPAVRDCLRAMRHCMSRETYRDALAACKKLADAVEAAGKEKER